MLHTDTTQELRDYASYLVTKYREVAVIKSVERAAVLEEIGREDLASYWRIIGEEVAALLQPDPSYLTH